MEKLWDTSTNEAKTRRPSHRAESDFEAERRVRTRFSNPREVGHGVWEKDYLMRLPDPKQGGCR